MFLCGHIRPKRFSESRESTELVRHRGIELSNGSVILATSIATAIHCPSEPLLNRLTKGGEERLRRQLSAIPSTLILHRRPEQVLPHGVAGALLHRSGVTAARFSTRRRRPS